MYSKLSSLTFIVAACLLLLTGCSKEDKALIYCSIYGKIDSPDNNSVTVVLENTKDSNDKYFAVSNASGGFEFHDVLEGTYSVSAKKEGLGWILMVYEGEPNHRTRIIEVKGSQSKQLEIAMGRTNSTGQKNQLDLTDYNGNPITSSIKVPKGTTTINLRLFNDTDNSHYWAINGLDHCVITIKNPDKYYFGKEDIFNSFSPVSGTLNPGEIAYIIGVINPEIYNHSGYIDYAYSTFELYDSGTRRDISLNIEY